MRRNLCAPALVLALFLIGAPAATADTITGGVGAAWQTWVVANLDQDNKPYWDGNSWDSSLPMNIGSCLTATGACTQLGAGAPGAIPFWGLAFTSGTDSGGGADSDFHFLRSSDQGTAALRLEIAGNAEWNTFGWYDTTAPVTLHEIFAGPVDPGEPAAVAVFIPSASYGFYLGARNGDIYRTQSSSSSANAGKQHFAVFQESATPGAEVYWIGVEDLRFGCDGCSSDKDYQDLVVRVQGVTNAVAEPGTFLLALTGLVGLSLIGRRRAR